MYGTRGISEITQKDSSCCAICYDFANTLDNPNLWKHEKPFIGRTEERRGYWNASIEVRINGGPFPI